MRRTTCNRDCPDACAIVAEVRDGRIVSLKGDPAHPVTRGFLCHRTGKFLDRQYAPDRLLRPQWRASVDDAFRPVSWDEALDRAAEALLRIRAESGAAAVLHLRGGGSLGMTMQAADALFERFGPVTSKRGDVCSAAGEAAQEADFGLSDSSDVTEWGRARSLVLWGRNLHVSSPHALARVKEARRNGARVALIDPVPHATGGTADETWQPRPGRDADLALAVARVLFERGWTHPDAAAWCHGLDGFRALAFQRPVEAWCAGADVPPAAAESLARMLGPGSPATILVGWGLTRRCNGSATVRVLDALAAVTGNVGVPGAGVSFYVRRRGAFDLSFATGAAARTYPDHRLGEAIETLADPPIRAAWITAANPVAMLPESARTAAALRSRELVVVADAFPTDTTRCAHLLLPTPTLLESDDLVGSYGHAWLGAARPVVPPPPDVRSDLWIAGEMARRLGVPWPDGDARAWQRRMVETRLGAAGVTIGDLERGPVRNPLAPAIVFEGRRFATPDGRARLVDALPPPPPDDADRPLRLMAVSHPASQCSQWVREPDGPLEVTVHPEAAAGIPDGGSARLESALGALDVVVRHDARQRRDVALCPKGGSFARGRAANALVRAVDSDLGDGAALYDEPVRLIP